MLSIFIKKINLITRCKNGKYFYLWYKRNFNYGATWGGEVLCLGGDARREVGVLDVPLLPPEVTLVRDVDLWVQLFMGSTGVWGLGTDVGKWVGLWGGSCLEYKTNN